MVFMTFNWKQIIQKKEAPIEKSWWVAVRVTLLPSFWSMLTALLGFLSLLFVPATPLSQLGLSGAMGTVIAFTSAYLIYPFFLLIQAPRLPSGRKATPESADTIPFFWSKHGGFVAAILLAAAAASIGLWRLDTEPSLFSYFKKGGEIRNSLEYIDQNGGSTPLNIVLANPDKTPFKMEEAYPRLWRLQNALERDPSVGSVMSLTLLLAEAKRSPLASLIPVNWVLKLLESPILGKTAQYYITKDQTKTLFVLRMKESYRQFDHLANVERLKKIIREEGFEPMLGGGTYLLYGKLSKLVASSIVEGLTLLILLFVIMGGIISRSLRVVGAMFISLGVIPLLMLGILGHLRVPIDIISAPGANIAIGIGVDAMIHVLIWVRRHPAGSMLSREAWSSVCSRLWKPILYSMCVVCAGFGIFILSGFPPTQRFGASVVLGTLLSPLPALFILPWFSTARIPKRLTTLIKPRNRAASR
jgi:predicted RND superfamily exporter protein